jgi:hypothetical protein
MTDWSTVGVWNMPQSSTKICVLDDLLEPALVEQGYANLQLHRVPASTIYVPVTHLDSNERLLAELGRWFAPPVTTLLATYCRALMQKAVAFFDSQLDGFEIWANCLTKCGPDVWVHLDNDEKHRRETGQVLTPLFGSVLHLGPIDGIKGGATFFCLDNDQIRLDQIIFKHLPWDSLMSLVAGSGMSVPFRGGRTILFDGKLAHCVSPFILDNERTPRLTLLVNGWSHPIKC